MVTFAPAPGFAQGPEIPESGYVVTDLGGGVHGITQRVINTMFLVTKNGVVLVDAPPVLGEKLLMAIEEVTPKPVTHLIYSHPHADHTGTAHLLDRRGPAARDGQALRAPLHSSGVRFASDACTHFRQQKPEARSQKPEARSQKPEDRSQKVVIP
ncbi:MBL fold metallo-hydrolase [Streptomyces sp. NPDC054786]